MSSDFMATPATIVKALSALRDTEYPKRKGERVTARAQWEEHHRECIQQLRELLNSSQAR